jgi:hypothetical protein
MGLPCPVVTKVVVVVGLDWETVGLHAARRSVSAVEDT